VLFWDNFSHFGTIGLRRLLSEQKKFDVLFFQLEKWVRLNFLLFFQLSLNLFELLTNYFFSVIIFEEPLRLVNKYGS
jgi:hypothetical protein